MSNIMQIKRSLLTTIPTSLAYGELAYSFKTGTQLLYIGDGTNIFAIGGKSDHDKLQTIESGAQVNTVTSVAGRTGAVTLTKSDITNFVEADYVHTTGTESISGDKTFSNNLIVSGDLTVNGTVTHINSTTVDIGDNILILNSAETGTPSANAGIEVERGTSENIQFIWNESLSKWGTKLLSGAFTAFSIDGHTHTSSDITNFSTAVDARIGLANIDDLNDVVLTSPTTSQFLTYNGTSWVNTTYTAVFTDLTDVPTSYTGQGNKLLRVNNAETGLEFIDVVDGGTF